MNDLDLDDIFVSNQFNIATQEILLLKEKYWFIHILVIELWYY